MFLTKFFKRLSGVIEIKWQFVVVELFIVFIGVYLAFSLNNHQQEQYVKKEGEKVWSSLKLELELEIIKDRLGFKKSLELEKVFIQQQIIALAEDAPEELILQKMKEYFPKLSEEQMKNIYNTTQKK